MGNEKADQSWRDKLRMQDLRGKEVIIVTHDGRFDAVRSSCCA